MSQGVVALNKKPLEGLKKRLLKGLFEGHHSLRHHLVPLDLWIALAGSEENSSQGTSLLRAMLSGSWCNCTQHDLDGDSALARHYTIYDKT